MVTGPIIVAALTSGNNREFPKTKGPSMYADPLISGGIGGIPEPTPSANGVPSPTKSLFPIAISSNSHAIM